MKYDDVPIELLLKQLEKLKTKKWGVPDPVGKRLILPQDLPPVRGPFPSPPPNKRVVIFDI
jgi:hypothetical protein